MKNKLLSNLSYLASAGLGLLTFILFAIPYISAYYKYDYGQYGGKGSNSEGVSGYKVMDLWDAKFSGVMSSLIQILILILAIAMLIYGVLGLLKAFDILDVLPDKIWKFETKKYGEFSLYGYAGLNVLLLIFLIILCATNSEKESVYGMTVSAGIRLSAGIFITLILSIGIVVGYKVLQIKCPVDEEKERKGYYCSKCDKKVKSSVKFCPECGGQIIEKTNE